MEGAASVSAGLPLCLEITHFWSYQINLKFKIQTQNRFTGSVLGWVRFIHRNLIGTKKQGGWIIRLDKTDLMPDGFLMEKEDEV